MSVLDRIITGITATGDRVKEPDLRTRYYRGPLREVVEQIRKLPTEDSRFHLIHVDEDRGEVMVEHRGAMGITHDLVITPVAMTPLSIAVDVHAAIRGRMWDFGGKNRKLIQAIYTYLDKHLTSASGSGR
jgi:hypothetical protein